MGIGAADVATNVYHGETTKAAIGVVSVIASAIPGGGAASDVLANAADLGLDVASDGLQDFATDVVGDTAGDLGGDYASETARGIVGEVAGQVKGAIRDTALNKAGLGFLEIDAQILLASNKVGPSTAKKMKDVAKKIRENRKRHECYFKYGGKKI